MLTVETPRLLLSPVAPQDAGETAMLLTDDIAAQLSTWTSPMSEDEALERIVRSERLLAEREAINFAIRNRGDKALVGWTGFWRISDDVARVGYWIGRAFRQRGLMSEALAHAIPAGSQILGHSIVEAIVLPGNTPSVAVLRKLEFIDAGEADEFIVTQNREVTCLRLILDLQPDRQPAPTLS